MSGPRFEEVRQRSYDVLAKVQERLRSDWVHDDTGPSHAQITAMDEARTHLAAAKAALARAASQPDAAPSASGTHIQRRFSRRR